MSKKIITPDYIISVVAEHYHVTVSGTLRKQA